MRRLVTAAEYIRDRVSITASGCWEWTQSRHPGGYAQGKYAGRKLLVHRFSYETFVGPIPDGLTIDHLCRNRGCVNPEHLEAVTQRINNYRGESVSGVNVRKTHCPQGHVYDDTNTYRHPDGSRKCRECLRANVRESARRRTGYYERDRELCRKQLHEMSPENTYVLASGVHRCRACRNEAARRFRAKR